MLFRSSVTHALESSVSDVDTSTSSTCQAEAPSRTGWFFAWTSVKDPDRSLIDMIDMPRERDPPERSVVG